MKTQSISFNASRLQKYAILICLLLLLTNRVFSNNISLSNVSLTGQNIGSHYTMVKLDLSWENSWRVSAEPLNWDAAWVFVKYKVANTSGGDGLWRHSTINVSGHNAPAGSTITVPADGMGGFVYRSADGVGSFSLTNLQLRWNYGVDYKNPTTLIGDADIIDIQVFAIEMVYVPLGSFELGSGGSGTSEFYKYPLSTSTFRVTSEDIINVGITTNYLYYAASGTGGDQSGPIPAAFPKGYNAFYCMKHEISQQGYVDFLNKLSPLQASNRYPNAYGNYRNGILSGAVYSTTLPYLACNYLSWADVTAYLDWTGLRPMTELEFEKACRGGTNFPIPNEAAWGTASNFGPVHGLLNPGLINELPSAPEANCTYGMYGPNSPIRVGMFAKTGTTRVQAGATFYGILEMSGNVWERIVTVGNPAGRLYTGMHGNGLLDGDGFADVSNWPNSSALGSGLRGGDFQDEYFYLWVSQRYHSAMALNGRFYTFGGRGVRTAP